MKKLIKFFGILLLIIILLVVGILFYIGLIPGYVKPVDLGAKVDPNFLTTFDASHGMQNLIPGGVVAVGKQAEFTGQKELVVDLSANEVSSILAAWKKRSPSLPVRNVQVRFNPDGTGEISGILEVDTAISIAKSLGYSENEIEIGKKFVKYTFGDLAFYAKGTGGVINNKVNLNPTEFKVGNISVPQDITKQVAPVVSDSIERRIKQVKTIQVNTLDFSSGKLHFDGIIPDTIK